MKVLVTGASGFLGKPSVAVLARKGHEVHAVSSKLESPPAREKNINWHEADLLDPAQVEALMAKVRATHLLHFAWYAEPGKYWTSAENYRWVEASMHLARAFTREGGKRAVFAGSCAEYDWSYGVCSEMTTPLAPRTVYGECKNSLHRTLEAFGGEAGLSLAWGRIFFLFGPREHPDRLVSSVIRSLLRGESAKCTKGTQVRDFLFVEKAASAFVALLESEITGAVNIASGRPLSVKVLVTKIGEKIGRSELIRFGELNSPMDDPPVLLADVNRLCKEVKWDEVDSLDSDLQATIDWWRVAMRRPTSS